jgi:hypothetical protein
MAYTLFSEVHAGRQATVDSKFNRTYQRVFLVRTDSATYGPYYAGSHPSLPAIFSAHPEDALAYCLTLAPSQDQDDPLLWRVTATYGYNLDMTTSGSAPSGNPAVDTQQQGVAPASRVQAPASRGRDYQIATNSYPLALAEAYYTGTNSMQPVENSAGEPLLPPLTGVYGGATITVGLNSLNSPSAAWIGSIGFVNAASYTIGPYVIGAKLAKLNSVNAQLVYENDVSYWRWSLVFEYRPNGWGVTLANMGKKLRITAGASGLKDILINGVPTSVPLFLNSTGTAVWDSATDSVSAKYRTYVPYNTTTFPSL